MTADTGGAQTLVRNPNELPDRAALGLPAHFVARVPAALAADVTGLVADRAGLAAQAEDATVGFALRHAAGFLLGLLGDPRIDQDAPAMRAVPGGSVRIGLPAARVDAVTSQWAGVGVVRSWIEKEVPEHTVSLRPYAMMRYPVTNAEYRRFLEDTGCPWLPTSWPFGVYPAALSNHPVWTVPPEAADAYARWLAGRTGRPFRLPTEAEWEHAARGPADWEFPWGDGWDPAMANTAEAGPLSTTPVGIYPAGASAFGILDMGGNVEEYVADCYTAYPGGTPVRDDLARDNPQHRIARGGSWSRFGDLARCRRRHGHYPRPFYAIGFRLAEGTQ